MNTTYSPEPTAKEDKLGGAKQNNCNLFMGAHPSDLGWM
jgi:hypothetical protein